MNWQDEMRANLGHAIMHPLLHAPCTHAEHDTIPL
jgi:hypothetical protein